MLSRQQRCFGRQLRGCLMMLCVMIALVGCTAAQQESVPTPNTLPPTPAGTILPFTTIAQGEHSSAKQFLEKPHIIITTNVQEVDTALRQVAGDPPTLERNPHPVEQARQIDYNRFFAILVLQGKQATAGYDVTVQQIVRHDDQVIVRALFVEPKQGEGAAQVGTDPYHLVAVPKEGVWGRQIQFELVADGKVVTQTAHFIP
jgi:hypothetical protein